MKNFKIKLKKCEIDEAARFMVHVFNSYRPYTVIEYVHRLNLQSACVKFINKSQNTTGGPAYKFYSFPLNVNELLSLDYIFNTTNRSIYSDPYLWAIFNDIITSTKKSIAHDLCIEDNILLKYK